jgi:hypothetical protein
VTTLRFVDQFESVKIPPAIGVMQRNASHAIIQVGDRLKLIGYPRWGRIRLLAAYEHAHAIRSACLRRCFSATAKTPWSALSVEPCLSRRSPVDPVGEVMHVEIGYGRMAPTDARFPHHGRIGEDEIHRRLNFQSGSQTVSSARRARTNAVPPAIRRAVGVSGSTTRQNGVTAWSPDSQALTAPAAMSRNNLWVVTGQVTSAPYRTAIDRRTALSVPPPRAKSAIAAASSVYDG